jgi:hypothetical protein
MGHTNAGSVIQRGASGSYKDGISSFNAILTTTDATAAVIASIPVAIGDCLVIEVITVGMKSDATAGHAGRAIQGFRRQSAGNVTTVGTATITTIEDSASAPVVSFNANTTSQTAEIKVAGVASETWRWECNVRVIKIA